MGRTAADACCGGPTEWIGRVSRLKLKVVASLHQVSGRYHKAMSWRVGRILVPASEPLLGNPQLHGQSCRRPA